MNEEVICFGLGGSGSFFVSDVRREFELSNFGDCVCLLAEIGCGEESHGFFIEVLSKEPKMGQTWRVQHLRITEKWRLAVGDVFVPFTWDVVHCPEGTSAISHRL